MSAAERVAHAAKTIRAHWEQGVEKSPQVDAAQALEDAGQLLEPEVAAELKSLRSRVDEVELGPESPAPSDGPVPYALTDKAHAETATSESGPALPWAARMADEDLHRFLGDLAQAAIGYYHHDPEQQDRETLRQIEAACARWRIPGRCWRSDEPELSAAESAAKLRAVLAPAEDPHDSALHHEYRVCRDLPETGGDQS